MEKLMLNKNGKSLVDLVEAGLMTGISSWTLRKDVNDRKLPCIRRGGKRGKILLSVSDLEAYLGKHRIAAAGE